jgi:hypothetical protein
MRLPSGNRNAEVLAVLAVLRKLVSLSKAAMVFCQEYAPERQQKAALYLGTA